jgi:hypothetical protein
MVSLLIVGVLPSKLFIDLFFMLLFYEKANSVPKVVKQKNPIKNMTEFLCY